MTTEETRPELHREYLVTINVEFHKDMSAVAVGEAINRHVYEQMSGMIRRWGMIVRPQSSDLRLVDKRRYSELERLYDAHERMRQAARDMGKAPNQSAYMSACYAWANAAKEAEDAVNKLEAMNREAPAG